MKHLRSNAASIPQGIGPLFDSVKPNEKEIEKEYRRLIARENIAEFDGVTYEPKFDATRLRGEMAVVYSCMFGSRWHTLREIAEWIYINYKTVYSEAGISARLRDLRKAKFGSHTVNRRRRGDPKRGIFEYQLL